MSRLVPAAVGLAYLIAVGGCRSAPVAQQSPRAIPEPFVDVILKTEIEDRGGDLGMDGKAARSEDLAKQLDRASCSLTLPSGSERVYDLPGLYRACVPGTLVISKIYYCEKCRRWHAPVSATAFAITPDGACVTNYHVFKQVEAGTVMVVSDAWGTTYPVHEVLAASRKDDTAIFRVDTGNDRLTPLPLRTGALAGSAVAVISHPGGHFYSMSPGHVSRRVWRYRGMVGDMKELTQADVHAEAGERPTLDKLAQTLEISAEFGIGSSGGPVLDVSGNVVGMVSNTFPIYADAKERRALQMNFHHCVPAESILGLIRGAK